MIFATIDIGTSTIKAILYDESGNVIDEAKRDNVIEMPAPGHVVCRPAEVVRTVLTLMRWADERYGVAVWSFSTFMHGIFPVDSAMRPLDDCILWNDTRSEPFATAYHHNGIGQDIYRRTGTPIHPMSPLYKLMWYKRYRPELFAQAECFLSVKEYLWWLLSGELATDYASASATGMYDSTNCRWDAQAIHVAGITEGKLPPVYPGTHRCQINAQAAKDFRLSPNLELVLGATDGCLANLGSHCVKQNTAVITIGTSGAVRITSRKAGMDKDAKIFSYRLDDDLFITGGPINNGGIAYAWCKELFSAEGNPLDFALRESQPQPGLFLPFLSGERAPYWNAKLSAAYLGLTHSIDQNIMYRLTAEGVCFAIRDVLETLCPDTSSLVTLYANGGFTHSEEWIRLMASILKVDIVVLPQGDSVCFGAFLMAQKALGRVDNWEDCEHFFQEGTCYESVPLPIYDELFPLYRKSISALTPILEQLYHLRQSQ